MLTGAAHAIPTGVYLVTKLSDCEWVVVDPAGDAAGVTQDDQGPDLLGEWWAVEAVRHAEQAFDMARDPRIGGPAIYPWLPPVGHLATADSPF